MYIYIRLRTGWMPL